MKSSSCMSRNKWSGRNFGESEVVAIIGESITAIFWSRPIGLPAKTVQSLFIRILHFLIEKRTCQPTSVKKGIFFCENSPSWISVFFLKKSPLAVFLLHGQTLDTTFHRLINFKGLAMETLMVCLVTKTFHEDFCENQPWQCLAMPEEAGHRRR